MQHIVDDWEVLSASATEDPRGFFTEVCTAVGDRVRASEQCRLDLGRDSARDMWNLFRDEIAQGRRWFFKDLDAGIFQRLLDICVTMRSENAIDGGHVFYRARVAEAGRKHLMLKDLGAPPKEKATGGRANPTGIPMLYASTSEDIAVHEVRPTRQATVCTARFRPRTSMSLADFTPSSDHRPNPFAADENGDPYDPAEMYVAVTLGAIVGEALSEPLQESDNRTEYLPTQYVAEFVRHSGRDGIRFRSSFCSELSGLEGDNVVLFDPMVVEGMPRSLRRHVVTEVGVRYK